MTYYELFTKAENLLIHNKITLGEYHKMVQPLNEEVRKEGRWIDDTYIDEAYDIKGVKTWGTKAKCSECRFSKIFIERHSGQYEFCPRCGAKMKGEWNGNLHT